MTTTIIREPYQWPNPAIFPPRPPWVDKEITEIITWTKTHSSTAGATIATTNLSSSVISSNTAKESTTLDLTVSYRYYPSTVTHSPYVYGVGRTTYTRTYTHTETLSIAASKTSNANDDSFSNIETVTAITNYNAAISDAIIASTNTLTLTPAISISISLASVSAKPTTFATQIHDEKRRCRYREEDTAASNPLD